jgi:hypothetical protein
MFIIGVNNTCDKLFTGVNDNGEDTGSKSLSQIFSDRMTHML